STLRQL
ncbi:unnamed protein product, partial [Adineta steineri]